MAEGTSVPQFGLNHPKNYFGYAIALALGGTLEGADEIMAERDINNDVYSARRGAVRLGLISKPGGGTLTEFGQELVALVEREFGSADAGLDALGDLYNSQKRFIDVQPVWREILIEALQRDAVVSHQITLMQECHANTGISDFLLPELFFELYERDAEFATNLFLRDEFAEDNVPISVDVLSSDPLSTEFRESSCYYAPTVQELKSILFHAGILTTRGGDKRTLDPDSDAFHWGLEPKYHPIDETAFPSHSVPELADPDERASDYDRPERTHVTTSRVVRNTQIVNALKELYDYTCQVCGDRRQGWGDSGYAEGHHLQPLGEDHAGPDEKANILVLCPTCHADFDYGMLAIDHESLEVDHSYDPERDGAGLEVHEDHALELEFIRYHNDKIANNETG